MRLTTEIFETFAKMDENDFIISDINAVKLNFRGRNFQISGSFPEVRIYVARAGCTAAARTKHVESNDRCLLHLACLNSVLATMVLHSCFLQFIFEKVSAESYSL